VQHDTYADFYAKDPRRRRTPLLHVKPLPNNQPRCSSGCRASRHIKWAKRTPGETETKRRMMTGGIDDGIAIILAHRHPHYLTMSSSASHMLPPPVLGARRACVPYTPAFRASTCASCDRSVRDAVGVLVRLGARIVGAGASGLGVRGICL